MTAPEIFTIRLMPHRSLKGKHFRVLMICVGLGGIVTSLPFFLIGAWPVVGFMGLDVLLVYLAFRANYRAARAYEEVHLTALELQLAKVTARGARREWRFNPAWVRLEREDHVEFGLQRLALASRGRRVSIASFLGADEKERFASEFSKALATARRGPQFS